jgi:hypothetical protein
MTRGRSKLIFTMMIVYFFMMVLDFAFTMTAIDMEANPIAIYFIAASGMPLNLIIVAILVILPLTRVRVWHAIDDRKWVFFVYYFVFLTLIVGHLHGILSWVC